MGKNNQQRRAAKRKARVAAQAASARPAGGAAAGEAGSAAQLIEELMAGTAHQVHQHSRADQARTLIITGAKVVGIPSALDDAVRDLVVFGGADGRGEELLASREATVLLFEQIDTAYEHGWQPADLLHVVRREQSVRVARLAGAVVVAHGLAGRAPSRAGQDWVDQLEGMSEVPLAGLVAEPGWNVLAHLGSRAAVWDSWHDILALVGHWADIVPLQRLAPPPSSWGKATAAPAGARKPSGHDPKKLTTIRALLAKAEATEFTEEAEAFTAKAQDLMTRYAIDEALLSDETDDATGVVSRRVRVDNPYAATKAQLLATVGKINRVKTIWDDRHGIATVVGMPVDLDLAEMLFTSLLVQATKAMTEAGAVSQGGHRLDRSPAFRRAFLLSYAHRIGERLSDAGTHAQQEESVQRGVNLLPVLARQSAAVEKEFDRLFPHTTTSGSKRVDARGWQAGRAAADRAVLARGRLDGQSA
jgi:hypothetical protein